MQLAVHTQICDNNTLPEWHGNHPHRSDTIKHIMPMIDLHIRFDGLLLHGITTPIQSSYVIDSRLDVDSGRVLITPYKEVMVLEEAGNLLPAVGKNAGAYWVS